MDLSLLLRIAPASAESIPFLDSILLLERHYEQEHARTKLQAALHGMTLS